MSGGMATKARDREGMTDDNLTRDWLHAALGLEHGAYPFPWQSRLLAAMLSGQFPTALDLPTGLGKTSVMAIWLVARALGAPVPRRLIYVVDRRAVVDQATQVAEQLRAWVQSEGEVRRALGLEDAALPISTLRGQHADNRAWLADPSLPAIVLGTVDMVGSRLLFSGYGVSTKMRPYHAGLLGADSWVVLDEAHLVPPFERLVGQIATRLDADRHRLGPLTDAGASVVPPLRMLSLSATGRQPVAGHTFTLDDDDTAHPVVRQRLNASKRLMLFEAIAPKALPETLASHAWDLAGRGNRPVRVIVFANSRDQAQQVRQALEMLSGRSDRTELFVGGRRVFEREQAAARLQSLGFLAGTVITPDAPSFVVATSAGEVGIDLDTDHAVCDLVAWERMVQRLGRVNRRGKGDATVALVPQVLEDEAAQARQQAVLDLLAALPRHADGSHDGSPAALATLKRQPETRVLIEQASTPACLHPPLTRALVDSWAMTSLDEHTGRPEVAPWLRGWPGEAELPQTTVAWRRWLPVTEEGDGRLFSARELELFWDAAGPHLAEELQTESWRVLDWLLSRAKAIATAKPPVNDPDQAAAEAARLGPDTVMAVVWHDGGSPPGIVRAADLLKRPKPALERQLAGATLLVDMRIGGLAAGLLEAGSDEPAPDVSELGSASAPGPVPFTVRRHDGDAPPGTETGWRLEASIPLQQTDEGVTAWLVVRSRIDAQAGSEEGRSGAARAQLLAEHQAWAETAARRLAQALRLPPDHAEMLAVAARLHDEGKRSRRWQTAFHAPLGDRLPYAKTVGRPDLALLDGYRHEFGSLPHAEADVRVQQLQPDLRALCLHLIAAHHGAARPVIHTRGAEEPPSQAAQRARAVALRYAALSKVWGPWGLAWWEALLRAADQQASRRNDEEGSTHG